MGRWRLSYGYLVIVLVLSVGCDGGGGGGGGDGATDTGTGWDLTCIDELGDPDADPGTDPDAGVDPGDVPVEVPADTTVEGDAPWDADGDGPVDEVWHPAPGTSWQWQLSDYPVDTGLDVVMYDVDLFDTPQATIDALHDDGRIVVCYFSAGSREDWRDDADLFPPEAVGNDLDGWPGESWLDVRHAGVRSVMEARLDLAASKGCDGVEPDNVDGYTNDPGFPLVYDDQLDYNLFLAAEAHERGLSVGLKNDLDQVDDLVDHFDWALNEECFEWEECEMLLPFIAAGKAVFHVEYGGEGLAETVCPYANGLDFDTLVKNWDLDAWRVACR